jgi:biopolymer transport protein ExbD
MSKIPVTKPSINVTPLIDILLVLLIIFMLISPLKPASFKAKIPAEPDKNITVTPNANSLVVTVNSDLSINLNKSADFGTSSDTQKLIEKLSETFTERAANGVFREGTNEVEKTVFIKAPRTIHYGEVVKVMDAIKISGASPVGLQIDDLQ